MRIKIFGVLISLFCSLNLWAASQSYVGTGQGVFVQTCHIYPCDQIFLRFDIEDDHFRVIEGGYVCEQLQASYDPFTLTIVDGKLVADGQVVGDINAQELNLYEDDPSDQSSFHLNLRFDGDQLRYTETWRQNDLVQLEVSGKLSRNDD